MHSTVVKTLQYNYGFIDYIKSNSILFQTTNLSDETWIISSGNDQTLLKNIKAKCISLSAYVGGTAKRGIVTGLTEAFIISNEIRKRLIQIDAKNEEIIKPLLLGRNIKPYQSLVPDKYLLYIPWHFPFQNEPDIKCASINAEAEFKRQYPAIYNHLFLFKDKLKSRNKVETGIRYEWYALQRYASDYYHDFEKPKIMFQVLQVKPCFIYDDKGLFCNNSMWFIPSDNKALLGILNSKMGWWLISKYCSAIQNGFQLIWKYFGQIPIPYFTGITPDALTRIVEKIISTKKSDPSADTTALEAEIDRLVYELYGLTEEEIRIVEES
jgi:adenine-specific DNA-methyltransferase